MTTTLKDEIKLTPKCDSHKQFYLSIKHATQIFLT